MNDSGWTWRDSLYVLWPLLVVIVVLTVIGLAVAHYSDGYCGIS